MESGYIFRHGLQVLRFISGNYESTGGTGRFAGATGSGDIDAVGLLTSGLPVTGTMNGTIDYYSKSV